MEETTIIACAVAHSDERDEHALSELTIGALKASRSSFDMHEGTFPKGLRVPSGVVSVNILKPEHTTGQNLKRFYDLVHKMRSLSHPNVVGFVMARTRLPNLFFVTQYPTRGSIGTPLYQHAYLLKFIFKAARELAEGLNYLHENDLVHGHLNSQNILNFGNRMKISDYWLSNFNLETPDPKSDVFWYGALLWQLRTNEPPFSYDLSLGTAVALAQGLRLPIEDYSHDDKKSSGYLKQKLQELIDWCWMEDPQKRPTFGEIIDRLKLIEREPVENERREQEKRLAEKKLLDEKRRIEYEKYEKVCAERVSRGLPPVPFGEVKILHPTRKHKATIVWLHDNILDSAATSRKLGSNVNLPTVKWICPEAPDRSIGWYNLRDKSGLKDTDAYVAQLLDGEPDDVLKIVGGEGQGSCVALNFALKCALGLYKTKLDGAAGISSTPSFENTEKMLKDISDTNAARARANSIHIFLGAHKRYPLPMDSYHSQLTKAGFKNTSVQGVTGYDDEGYELELEDGVGISEGIRTWLERVFYWSSPT
uniref:Putative serine/threonine-protein kinase n=1 Tax=Noccaea caerulescens TaxID=107243 RepID=A0A1J3JTS9_NOCCA